jgi:hypothetical protein
MMNRKGNQMSSAIEFVDGKYVGKFNGKVVVRTSSKYYAERKMADFVVAEKKVEEVNNQLNEEFPIDTRFDFVGDVVKMVASKKAPSVIITGEGGLGKSYSVIKALKESGLKDMTEVIAESDIGAVVTSENTFVVFKGYSTAKALYRTLYENRNSIIVFDDTDSILKDNDALNVLKGALDSFDKRIISWNSEIRDENLPRMFQFKGGVVFISNMSPDRLDQALKSRSMCIDLGMTTEQKIQRMRTIIQSNEFLPDVPMEFKLDALSMIDECREQAREISLRTLISTTKIRANDTPNWKQLARYMLVCN